MVTGELVRGNYVGTRGDEGAGEGKADRENLHGKPLYHTTSQAQVCKSFLP